MTLKRVDARLGGGGKKFKSPSQRTPPTISLTKKIVPHKYVKGGHMALTAKKKAFAQSKHDGADNKQAAIFAGYSPESASQAGSRLAKDPDVIAHIERLKINTEVKVDSKPESRPIITKKDIETAGSRADPLKFLEEIWTDPVEDMKMRMDAAKAALPYFHGKVAEKGKKETKADEAKKATQGGKFGTLGSQLRS